VYVFFGKEKLWEADILGMRKSNEPAKVARARQELAGSEDEL